MIPISLLDKPIHKEDGDYIQDGLVFCGKCDTPKQCVINFLGVDRIVSCLCRCREEEQTKAYENEARWAHERYINYLRQTAFHSPMMSDWTFTNAITCKTITAAKNYADNFETFSKQSKGLLFFGDVGNGKSYASACVCNALIDRGIKVLMSNLARLTNELQADFDHRQDYIDIRLGGTPPKLVTGNLKTDIESGTQPKDKVFVTPQSGETMVAETAYNTALYGGKFAPGYDIPTSPTVEKPLLYTGTGLNQFFQDVGTTVDVIAGKSPEEIASKSDGPYSLASSLLKQHYTRNGQKFDIVVQDVVTNIANNAIPMLIGGAARGIGLSKAVSSAIGISAFGFSTFGNSYKQAASLGATNDKARL